MDKETSSSQASYPLIVPSNIPHLALKNLVNDPSLKYFPKSNALLLQKI